MFKPSRSLCAALVVLTAPPAEALVLTCRPDRMCFDHRPCALVADPQKEACLDRPACNAVGGIDFVLDLPAQGSTAKLHYPEARTLEARVLSRFVSSHHSDPAEQITLSVLAPGDADAPNTTLIYLELDRNADPVTAKAVIADLSTDAGRGTVTTYAACEVP